MATTKKQSTSAKASADKAKKATKPEAIKVKKTAKKTPKVIDNNGALAVIVTGGKQYLVREGQILNVERLGVKEGEAYTFDQVLLVSIGDDVKIGNPTVAGAKVTAQVEKEVRGEKVITQKYKNKTRSAIKKGHRQTYTRIKILEIKS